MKFTVTISLSAFFALSVVLPQILQAETLAVPASFSFQTTLKIGQTMTPDVSYLQFILNQNAVTRVAETGAGSIGNLTNYFGAKTESAVMRFQEMFRSEILTPAGLTNPTGIVGERTRTKLNQILATARQQGVIVNSTGSLINNTGTATTVNKSTATSSAVKTSTLSTTTASVSTSPSNINYFSTFKAWSGQLVSIFGGNFHPSKNTVYLGDINLGSFASSENGTRITFRIPSTIKTGSYEIGLLNAYGVTSTGDLYLNVANQGSTTVYTTFEPVLNRVWPTSSQNVNDIVNIYGDNLSFADTLETNLGNITIRSTDRKTTYFTVGNLPNYLSAFYSNKGKAFTLTMRVRNENGLSKQILTHTINFPNASSPTVNLNPQTRTDPAASSTLNAISDDFYETIYRRDTYDSYTDAERATSTKSSSSSAGASSGSTSGSGSTPSNPINSAAGKIGSNPNETLNNAKPEADPALAKLREVSPVHKFATDPLVKSNSTGGSGSSGGGALGGLFGGSGSGSSAGGAGGSMAGSGDILYFGGTITQSIRCTCSLSTYLEIDDYATNRTIKALYTPGISSLRDYRNIWTIGVYVLGGLQNGGGSCDVYYGEDCVTEGTAQYDIDYLRGIGTSQLPASGGGMTGGAGGI